MCAFNEAEFAAKSIDESVYATYSFPVYIMGSDSFIHTFNKTKRIAESGAINKPDFSTECITVFINKADNVFCSFDESEFTAYSVTIAESNDSAKCIA